MMLAGAAVAAVLIGLAVGALGGGGSILAVPALVYLLGQDAGQATAGSLVIVGLTALIGLWPHQRAGNVRVTQGAIFGAAGVAGSFVGSTLSARVSSAVLLTAFSGLLLVVAAMMTRRRRAQRKAARDAGAGSQPGGPVAEPVGARVATVVATASLVGALTGFFGVGGGFAVVPALVLALGFTMPQAVGTSLLVIAINSASALIWRVGQDVAFDWPTLAWFTALAVAGSLVGGWLAQRVKPDALSVGFTVLLVAVAGYTAARSIPQLWA